MDRDAYKVVMLRRARLGGRLFRVGQAVTISGVGALRTTWSLCVTSQAKPADERTRKAVELFGLLREATA